MQQENKKKKTCFGNILNFLWQTLRCGLSNINLQYKAMQLRLEFEPTVF